MRGTERQGTHERWRTTEARPRATSSSATFTSAFAPGGMYVTCASATTI